MKLIDVNVRLNENGIAPPELNVFNEDNLHIIHFQPYAKITYDPEKGSGYENDVLMTQKLTKFLCHTKYEHCDFAITPECCVPYEFLKMFIMNKDNWPEEGKLWCLGMAMCTTKVFDDSVKHMNSISEVKCIPPKNIKHYNKLCNSLMYVFRVKSELLLLPQLKNKPSKNEKTTTAGGEVYVFKHGISILSSLICSDGFSDLNQYNDKYEGYRRLFIHIQLADEPCHRDNQNMLTSLLKYEGTRVIGVNWANRTAVWQNYRRKKVIYHGYSSLYQMGHHLMVAANSQRDGFCQDKLDYITRWHLPYEEHIVQYRIRPFVTIYSASAMKHDLEEAKLYHFVDNSFVPWQPLHYCAVDWDWMNNTFSINCTRDERYCCFSNVAPFIDSFYLEENKLRTILARGFCCCAYRLPDEYDEDGRSINLEVPMNIPRNIRQELCQISEFVKAKKPNSHFDLQNACNKYNLVDNYSNRSRILFVDNEKDAKKYWETQATSNDLDLRTLICKTIYCHRTGTGQLEYLRPGGAPTYSVMPTKSEEANNSIFSAHPFPSWDISMPD